MLAKLEQTPAHERSSTANLVQRDKYVRASQLMMPKQPRFSTSRLHRSGIISKVRSCAYVALSRTMARSEKPARRVALETPDTLFTLLSIRGMDVTALCCLDRAIKDTTCELFKDL